MATVPAAEGTARSRSGTDASPHAGSAGSPLVQDCRLVLERGRLRLHRPLPGAGRSAPRRRPRRTSRGATARRRRGHRLRITDRVLTEVTEWSARRSGKDSAAMFIDAPTPGPRPSVADRPVYVRSGSTWPAVRTFWGRRTGGGGSPAKSWPQVLSELKPLWASTTCSSCAPASSAGRLSSSASRSRLEVRLSVAGGASLTCSGCGCLRRR